MQVRAARAVGAEGQRALQSHRVQVEQEGVQGKVLSLPQLRAGPSAQREEEVLQPTTSTTWVPQWASELAREVQQLGPSLEEAAAALICGEEGGGAHRALELAKRHPELAEARAPVATLGERERVAYRRPLAGSWLKLRQHTALGGPTPRGSARRGSLVRDGATAVFTRCAGGVGVVGSDGTPSGPSGAPKQERCLLDRQASNNMRMFGLGEDNRGGGAM